MVRVSVTFHRFAFPYRQRMLHRCLLQCQVSDSENPSRRAQTPEAKEPTSTVSPHKRNAPIERSGSQATERLEDLLPHPTPFSDIDGKERDLETGVATPADVVNLGTDAQPAQPAHHRWAEGQKELACAVDVVHREIGRTPPPSLHRVRSDSRCGGVVVSKFTRNCRPNYGAGRRCLVAGLFGDARIGGLATRLGRTSWGRTSRNSDAEAGMSEEALTTPRRVPTPRVRVALTCSRCLCRIEVVRECGVSCDLCSERPVW